MDLFGRTFDECLVNLNQMHARMGSMMPSLKPPRFVSVQTNSSENRLEYYSFRAGLGPMVFGLLEGLAEKHKTKISISYEPRKETHLPDIFNIKKVA